MSQNIDPDYDKISASLLDVDEPSDDRVEPLRYLARENLVDSVKNTNDLKRKYEKNSTYWLIAAAVLWLILFGISGYEYYRIVFKNITIQWDILLLHFVLVFPLIVGLWVSLFRFDRANFLAEHYAHLSLSLALVPRLSLGLVPEKQFEVISDFAKKVMDLPETKNKKCSNKTIDSSLTLIEKLVDKIPTPK